MRVSRGTGSVAMVRKLREFGRAHLMVVRDVVRTQNRIKSLLRSRGVPVEGKTVYGAAGRQEYVDQLPDGTRAAAATLFAQYDALQEIANAPRRSCSPRLACTRSPRSSGHV